MAVSQLSDDRDRANVAVDWRGCVSDALGMHILQNSDPQKTVTLARDTSLCCFYGLLHLQWEFISQIIRFVWILKGLSGWITLPSDYALQ